MKPLTLRVGVMTTIEGDRALQLVDVETSMTIGYVIGPTFVMTSPLADRVVEAVNLGSKLLELAESRGEPGDFRQGDASRLVEWIRDERAREREARMEARARGEG